MNIVVTPLYAGILSLIYLVLTSRVIRGRRHYKNSSGRGEGTPFGMLVRAHGNFIEYVPILLILMLLLEVRSGSLFVLHGCGILIVITRLIHAYGLGQEKNLPYRIASMSVTMALLFVLGVLNIINGLG